jgi:DNA-binding NtrC family response regulator
MVSFSSADIWDVTTAPEKTLFWISEEPFDASQWPILSATYTIRWISPANLAVIPPGGVAVVLASSAADWQTAERLQLLQATWARIPVLIYDPAASPGDAVRLARLGACQFLPSDDDAAALLDPLWEEARNSSNEANSEWEQMLVGEGAPMRQVRQIVRMVADRRSTVLITGETGTGKELAARSLHLASLRKQAPWVAVNCSALPENLLESELFGHVKGAFTGAMQNRTGRFEEAQGGTLFLDEIGDLNFALQAKLLRVIQERELQRLGSSETVHLNVRLVAATNYDLRQRVEDGLFREDLFYRLNVVPIRMPPLRHRRDDIPRLATHFVQKICRLEQIAEKRLTSQAIDRLSQYSWPGNVRQLENMIEMAVALSGSRELLDTNDFPLPTPPAVNKPIPISGPVVSVPDHGMDFEQTVALIERSILEQALQKTGGNKKAAADMLGLKRTTLSAKVRSLDAEVALN